MTQDTADYERSEAIAIASGKEAFARSPWLLNRVVGRKGLFAELRRNDAVHPRWYSVHVVDGVGTKLFFAPWSGDYASQMMDGIEMNANDMATTIYAYPSEINIYLACQTGIEINHMGEIADGIRKGLKRIRIPDAPFDLNLGKLETASLDEMIALGIKDRGFDVGFSMIGYIRVDKVPVFDPRPGFQIVGVSSTGLHSNGYTSARHVIFAPSPEIEYRDEWIDQYRGKWHLQDKPAMLEGKTIMEAMMVPTASYLVEASLIGREFANRYIYGVNITGNGLHNFNRAGENVTFHITHPLEPLPIHRFLMQESRWDTKTAHTKQNMGMGFAYIVPNKEIADRIIKLINQRGQNNAQRVGEVKEASKSQEKLTTILHAFEGEIPFEGYSN